MFRNKKFDGLVQLLIEMLEAMQHSKTIQDKQEDGWALGDIPKLPNGYWENSENRVSIYPYMLLAGAICVADQQSVSLPIDRWRIDLTNAGALSNDVDQFLRVLNGAPPDDSFFQQTAAFIFALRSGDMSLVELWKGSFRLLNALMGEKRLVETALEKLLITRWLSATKNQRFAFSTPSLACPEIEKYCLNQSLSGLSKIAAVLDIAAPYLNIPMSSDAKQMIKKIIEQG